MVSPFQEILNKVARFGRGGSDGGDSTSALLEAFAEIAAKMEAANAASAGSATAALDFSREQLAEQKRQFGLTFGLQEEAQEFGQQDLLTQRLLEAAGLATSPAGAIQLAFMARGQGAPTEDIRNLFQRLPFVEALNRGETLPGFGLPEQLGGAGRTKGIATNQVTGSTFGTTLPSTTGITEQQFSGLSDFEKIFLGQLFQAETGESAQGFLSGVMKSFIPTIGFGV